MGLKRFFHTCLLALSFNGVALPVSAQKQAKKHKTAHAAPAPKISVPYYAKIVVDAANGKILYDENADKKLHPASTLKIMTAYLTFAALEDSTIKLQQKLHVSAHAKNQATKNLALGARGVSTITAEDALKGLLVQSANDAAVVLAEAIGKNEAGFVKMMNAKAKEIGMKNTHFINANGLPVKGKEQWTTVADMAVLARHVMQDYPAYYHYFGIESFSYKGTTYPNHNKMLGVYPGMDGLKTGYTNKARCNLVASAKQGGKRVIGIVFGAPNGKTRSAEMTKLLDFGFSVLDFTDNSPQIRFKPSLDMTIAPPVLDTVMMPDKIIPLDKQGPRP